METAPPDRPALTGQPLADRTIQRARSLCRLLVCWRIACGRPNQQGRDSRSSATRQTGFALRWRLAALASTLALGTVSLRQNEPEHAGMIGKLI